MLLLIEDEIALPLAFDDRQNVAFRHDQVLLIVQALAGYSLGEADIVRKAMGKKVPAIMQQERQKFIDGALAQGYDRQLAGSKD